MLPLGRESDSGVEVFIGLVALDFAVYAQHAVHHAIPLLWRLHMVHHADLDFDMITGLRFHPIEIIVSMAGKLAVVAALGAAPWAVLISEGVLNATSIFNHGNIRLPEKMDRLLRLIVVTPDMHRVHHSVVTRETNSNFGFSLYRSLWHASAAEGTKAPAFRCSAPGAPRARAGGFFATIVAGS